MYKETSDLLKHNLGKLLEDQTDLELAILIGSQSQGKSTVNSDWDIAIRWVKHIKPLQRIGKTETLRRLLAKQLNQLERNIDLIDLTTAKLAMCAVVAEEGKVLKGEDSLAWAHFLQYTWRELERFYWDKIYVS